MDKTHENLNNEAENTAQNSANSENQGETKTFSQEKLDEIVQKRLREQKEKFEKQTQKQIAEAIEDFKRKSQLSEEELRSEELENQKNAFEQEKQAFEKEKTTFEMRNFLSEAGLNPELASFINSNNSESNKQIVELLKKDFEETLKVRVDEQLKENLRGQTPSDPTGNDSGNSAQSGIIAL